MSTTPDNKATATAFKLITSTLDRDELADILFNWNESGLSADGDNIIQHVGRDRQFSRGGEGGKARVGKKEFIAWLLSDGPLMKRSTVPPYALIVNGGSGSRQRGLHRL